MIFAARFDHRAVPNVVSGKVERLFGLARLVAKGVCHKALRIAFSSLKHSRRRIAREKEKT
jgi:hypothetical protein